MYHRGGCVRVNCRSWQTQAPDANGTDYMYEQYQLQYSAWNTVMQLLIVDYYFQKLAKLKQMPDMNTTMHHTTTVSSTNIFWDWEQTVYNHLYAILFKYWLNFALKQI